MGKVEIMAFGLEDNVLQVLKGIIDPDLLRALQVGVSAFILGTVLIAFHKVIKKYNLDDEND